MKSWWCLWRDKYQYFRGVYSFSLQFTVSFLSEPNLFWRVQSSGLLHHVVWRERVTLQRTKLPPASAVFWLTLQFWAGSCVFLWNIWSSPDNLVFQPRRLYSSWTLPLQPHIHLIYFISVSVFCIRSIEWLYTVNSHTHGIFQTIEIIYMAVCSIGLYVVSW